MKKGTKKEVTKGTKDNTKKETIEKTKTKINNDDEDVKKVTKKARTT